MEEILKAGLMALNMMGAFSDNPPAGYSEARMMKDCAVFLEHARGHADKHLEEIAFQCGLFKDTDRVRTLSDIKSMRIQLKKVFD